MPPWQPQEGYGDFQDDNHLTDAQIRLIADWVKGGASKGPETEIPSPPQLASGWQLGPPDMILTAPQPFFMPASGPDVFWNFVFKVELETARCVRAIEIHPDAGHGNVHHANILVDRTGSVGRLEISPRKGFPGMDLNIDRSPFDPEGHFLFWKPGTVPYSEPDGFSWRLYPGNYLVLNTHLQPIGKPERVQPTIGLYFTDKPPEHFPLLIQLEDDNALNIPAGDRDFVISDKLRLPVDVDVLAIYPHAHYLGKLLEAYAILPDGMRKWLIRIPSWDLNWQAVYRYREPVYLPRNSVIWMRYQYDNSASNPRNPNAPPKRVRAGNDVTDEMGHLWLQILPRGPGDHRMQLQEAVMRHRLEKDPGDFAAHLNLGALMLARFNSQGAISMLEAASRIDPTRPEPHDMLGVALQSVGRNSEAIVQFRLASAARPDYVNARYNLAHALAKSGKLDEAIENFRHVATAYPKNALLQDEFGKLLARAGRLSEALDHLNTATALDPSNESLRKDRDLLASQIAAR